MFENVTELLQKKICENIIKIPSPYFLHFIHVQLNVFHLQYLLTQFELEI